MKNGFLKTARVIPFLFGIFFFFFIPNIHSQEDARTLLENLEEEDLKNLDALAMYPEETRLAILQASLYPEVLIKIDRIQTKTSEDFTELINQYPEQTQREVWDLTRYPNLIHRLLFETNRNKFSIDNILSDYPKAVHQRAKDCLKNHYDLLKKIDALNQTNETAFNNIISNYDTETQTAFRQLIELPEVLTVMTENIEVTILVGDAYKNYPEWVLEKAESRHLELARENTQELEDWKKRIEENPEAAEDLQASAEDFAKENGYDDLYYDSEDYDYPEDDLYYSEDERESIVIEKHYHYNYPYWYGYPTWYAYPRWRPYPYWYDWGFHYRPGRRIVIIQMPSFYFVDWYFYRPIHHHHYPHLSAHFVGHYYGHRRSVGSVTSTVRHWRHQNRDVITDDLVSNAPRRVHEFKEFGKMEVERKKYNTSNPRTPLTQKKFIEKNQKSYPRLKKEVARRDVLTSKGKPDISPKKEKIKPREKFPKKKNTKSRSEIPKVKKKNEKPNISQPKKRTPKVNTTKKRTKTKNAKDYHKKTWEKTSRKNPMRKVVPKKKKTITKKPTRIKKTKTRKPIKKTKTRKKN